MKIGIPAETRPGETRVAATPETVKKLVAAKHQVVVQAGAGVAASITDEAYAAAGRCDTFEEYRRVCGVVQGLNYAENIIEDLVQKMEKSDD